MKSDFDEQAVSDIYKNQFHNECFAVSRKLQDLQGLFHVLGGDKILLLDRYMLVERQLQLALRESQSLVSVLKKIDGDFRIKKEKNNRGVE